MTRHALPRSTPFLAAALAGTLLAGCTENAMVTDAEFAASRAVVVAPPVTLEWQATARTLVAQRAMSPLAASRMFAAASMAAMRAVEAVDAGTTGATSRNENGYGAGGRARYEARRGAVAGASASVLAGFVPSAGSSLEQLLADQGDAGPGAVHPQFARGVAAGRAAAQAVLAHVAADGFTATWDGTIKAGSGVPGSGIWTMTAPPPAGYTLGQVTPWFVTSATQFAPADPPAYLSPAFNADLAETKAIRAGATSTSPQTLIALKWAYGNGTYTPVGYWNELAATYVAEAGMDEAEAAKVFGLMGAAVFDALITAFHAKYEHWVLRPHQADPSITTAFPVPNYPAYPSGHGSVSGASGRVLAYFFPEHAAELDALVTEAALSRIYAGIHYRFDQVAARSLSENIADWVIEQGM